MPAEVGERGDAASLGMGPGRSKGGSGGTRGAQAGRWGEAAATGCACQKKEPRCRGRLASKPSGAVEAGRGEATSWAKWGTSKGEACRPRSRENAALL